MCVQVSFIGLCHLAAFYNAALRFCCGDCSISKGSLDWFEVDLGARPASVRVCVCVCMCVCVCLQHVWQIEDILYGCMACLKFLVGWLRLVGSLKL